MQTASRRRIYTGEEWLTVDGTKNRWIVPGIIPRAGRTFVYGQGSTYKSTIIFDLALAVSSGGLLLRQFPVSTVGPVLLVSAEGNVYENRERMLSHCRAHDVNLAEVKMHYCQEPFLLDDASDRTELILALESIRPKMLVLDPLDSFFSGDENSATETKPLRRFLDDVVRNYELSVLVIHHESKRGELRGSSAFYNWADTVIHTTMNKVKLDKKGPEVEVISLEGKKIRNGKRGRIFSVVPFIDELMGTTTFTVYEGGDLQRIAREYSTHLIYRVLRSSEEPLTISEIVTGTDLKYDTVTSCLYDLRSLGFATQEDTKRSTGRGRERSTTAWAPLVRQTKVDLALRFLQNKEEDIENELEKYNIEPRIDRAWELYNYS